LDIRRDWGWAPEYVEVMRRMWQQKKPDDYVVATEKEHSLQQFVAEAFRQLGLDWR
jgi:GDPmannose 4,6-dehydratase